MNLLSTGRLHIGVVWCWRWCHKSMGFATKLFVLQKGATAKAQYPVSGHINTERLHESGARFDGAEAVRELHGSQHLLLQFWCV